MARSVITMTSPAVNASAVVTKDAIDAVNGHSLDMAGKKNQSVTIFIEMTTTVLHTVSVKAGDFEDKALEDLDIELSAVGLHAVSIETARFKDYDGLVLIDIVSTGAAGNLFATELPVG